MSYKLTISLAQTSISKKPEENIKTALQLTQRAAGIGADLVVFPEMFMALPENDASLTDVAEPFEGPFYNALTVLAKKHSIAITCGLWESIPSDQKRVANVAVAIDSEGKLLARYQKIHLFDALSVRESDTMIAGSIPPPVFEINGVKLGMAICYDLRFPELFRNLAHKGAEAVIVPSAWYAGILKEAHWLTMLRSRAIENTIYVAGANLCGTQFSGRSAIFDPFGVMIADSGEMENLASAVINTQRIADVRGKLPTLQHVRHDLFR